MLRRLFGLFLWILTAAAAALVVFAGFQLTRDFSPLVTFAAAMLAALMTFLLGALLYSAFSPDN